MTAKVKIKNAEYTMHYRIQDDKIFVEAIMDSFNVDHKDHLDSSTEVSRVEKELLSAEKTGSRGGQNPAEEKKSVHPPTPPISEKEIEQGEKSAEKERPKRKRISK